MVKINKYVDINTLDKEAKRDYIDRHSAFIKTSSEVKAGEFLTVTVRVGDEYPHPDDFDHYIAYVQLFNGDVLLGQMNFTPGAVFGNGGKGNVEVDFKITLQKKAKLTAVAYCTKHGIWESDMVKVDVV